MDTTKQRELFVDPYDDPRSRARKKLLAPAIMLMIFGILNVILIIFSSLKSDVAIKSLESSKKQMKQIFGGGDPASGKFLVSMVDFRIKNLALINGISAIAGAITAIAGFSMLGLNLKPICYLGSILTFLPFTNCCCCLGGLVGFWSLIVLQTDTVQAAFFFQSRIDD